MNFLLITVVVAVVSLFLPAVDEITRARRRLYITIQTTPQESRDRDRERGAARCSPLLSVG
jgi:hypothetical protein